MKIRLAALILALVIGITLIFQVLIPQNNNVYTDGSNNGLSFEDLQSMVGGLEDESQVSVGEDGSIIINGNGTDESKGDVLEETASVPVCDCGNSSNHNLSQHSDLCARKKSVIGFAKLYNPQGLYSIYDTLDSEAKEFLLYFLRTQDTNKYNELQVLINTSIPTENEVSTTVDNKTISIEGNIPKGAVLNTSVTDKESQEFLINNIVKQFCTSNSKVYAYDISMSKDGRDYQPDGYFTATIENMVGKIPEGKKARINVIHFLDTKEAVDSAINSGIALKYTSDKDLSAMFPEETKASNNNKVIYYTKTGTYADYSNEGDSVFSFEVTSFSTYMFTVDFYYGENLYKMPGGESMLLSELFEALDMDYDVANVSSATVDEAAEAFLNISEQADGDFVISSTGVTFTTWHELTVTMDDGEVVYITFTDATYPTFDPNANNPLDVNGQVYPSIIPGTISGDKTWTINYTGGSKGSIVLLIGTTAGVIIPSGASLTIKLNDATKNYYNANPDATPVYFRRSGDIPNHKPYFKVNGTGRLTIEGHTYANGTKKALEIRGNQTDDTTFHTERFIHDSESGYKSTITLSDIAIDIFHNSTGGGGVITVANGSLTVNNCIMDECLSTKSGAGAGAALRVQNSATLTVNNTTITNSYSSTQGGAIYLDATSTATLNNVSISGCSAADKGGAISNNGTVTIKNSSFSNNTVIGTDTDARGGALWIGNNTTTTIEYSSFTNCSAYLGGAIGMNSYTTSAGTNNTAYVINPSTIIGTTFNGNSATENGGACYFDNQKGYLRVVDCDFIGNHAGQSGGAIYQSGTSMDIGNVAILSTDQLTNYGLTVANAATTRSVFTGNYAANGGALYVNANRSCGLKGTQITGNYSTNNPTDTTGGGGVFLDTASTGLTVGHYNNITGNYSGVSNIANLTNGTLCNVLLPGNKTTPDNTRFFAQTNGLRTPATDPLSGSIGVYTTNLGKQFIVTADCTNGGHHAFTYGESRFRADGGDAAIFTCDRNTLGTSRYRYVSQVNDATNGCNDLYFENGTVLDRANFHWEGLSPNPTTIYTTAASNRVVPPTVSRTGYDLEAWVRDDGVSFPASNNYVLVEPINSSRPSYNDFTPDWTPAKYDVTFNANGGTPTTVVEQTYTAEYILPTQPTRQGYTFEAWYTEASGGTKVTEATTVTTTADHTLYAHWSKNKYTVTFNANGGTPATAETEQTYDSYYAFPTQPTRTGYNFVGWFTEAENGTQVYETTTVKTADEHTLYAHWTKKTMTVTFRSGVDGLNPSPATITVTYGEAYGQLPTLSREYHDFLGWYTDPSAGTKVIETTVVTEESDHSLYARWEKSKCVYVISFDANCGDVDAGTMPVSSTQSSQDESYQHTWSETPTRPGHIFMGWATASDGDVVVDKDTFIYNMTCQPDEISSVTLYAVWRWNTATITIKNAAAAGTSVNPGQVFAYNVAFGVNTDNEFGVTIKGLGSVTIYECEIMDLDLAQYINYSVENVNDWSWRYDSNGDASFDFASHDLRDDYGVPNKMPHVVVTFTYAKDNDAWASYHSDIEVLNQ